MNDDRPRRNEPAMTEFPVDWLGRCGLHSFVVDLSPQEVRDHLQQSLTPESFLNSILAFDRRYTGTIREDRFVIYPCKRGRNFQPNMIGTFKQTETGTCIEFRIEMDAMVSAWFVGMPFVFVGLLIGIPALKYFGGHDLTPPLCLAPAVIFLLAVFMAIGILQLPRESTHLLRFFLDQFRTHRLPDANLSDRDLPR